MTNKNDDLLKHLLETFQEEAKEHIQTINRALLNIERDSDNNEDDVQNAFRAAHNLKGAARMVGLMEIESLAHSMENVLQAARDNNLNLDANTCDILYDSLDILEQKLGDESVDTQEIQEKLANLQASEAGVSDADVAKEETDDSTDEVTSETPNDATDEVTSDTPQETLPPVDKPNTNSTQAPKGKEVATNNDTIRVPINKLDDVMAEIGELQISKINAEQRRIDLTQLEQQFEQFNRRWNDLQGLVGNGNGQQANRLKDVVELQAQQLQTVMNLLNNFSQSFNRDALRLGMVTDELRDKVRRVRMLPFRSIVLGLERVVRDAAHLENKTIDFVIEGDETELDKKILEILKDPLVHLLRNAVSHGIESSAERSAANKPSQGHIKLSLQQRGSEVHILVSDDGRGFDIKALQSAYQKQTNTSQEIPDNIIDLAFRPGISTAEQVNILSGRGVGLDVVRQQLEAIQGRISLQNVLGQGVTISLIVPTSLAVTHALLVQIGSEQYALPLLAIEKIVETEDVKSVGGKYFINLDDQHLPLVSLAQILDRPIQTNRENFLAVVIAVAEHRLAIRVDNVLTEQELAVKPLGSFLEHVPHVTGAGLLGDGLPIVMLNPADIVRSAQNLKHHNQYRTKTIETSEKDRVVRVLVVDDSITTRTLEKNILEAAGYLVWTATNGMEALRQLEQQQVDIVISDVQMPQMDGVELARQLRKHEKYSTLPIILVTSLESREDKEQGMLAGADAYIVKRGFSQTELLDTIEQLI